MCCQEIQTRSQQSRCQSTVPLASSRISKGAKISTNTPHSRNDSPSSRVRTNLAAALSNYQLEGFSVERLMNFLTALDRDVDIVIRRRPGTRRRGRIVVTAA